MLTKNNWCTSNILDKINNNRISFDAYINPYQFQKMSFDEACCYTANLIHKEYKKLYLALSGGMDSEFILRTFHRFDIPITPIIVSCGSEKENEYAHTACDELGIIPIVLSISQENLLWYYKNFIYDKFGGIGYNSTHTLIAAEYVIANNGTLITGNHFMGDGYQSSIEYFASANEWDFYTDGVFKESNNIDFLLYTPEIVYASMPQDEVIWCEYKSKLYNVKFRNKIRHSYSKEITKTLMNLSNSLQQTSYSKKWSRKEFYDIFDKVKIK